jgi:hypothetical protein
MHHLHHHPAVYLIQVDRLLEESLSEQKKNELNRAKQSCCPLSDAAPVKSLSS